MRRMLVGTVFAIAALTTACVSPLGLGTGLMGTVVRGPITPVCMEGVPCDAPFAAHFDVFQGSRRVASFDSDADGQYSVRLAPGTYRIVPGPNAPIMQPASQAYTRDVGPKGMTVVHLQFDTGIR